MTIDAITDLVTVRMDGPASDRAVGAYSDEEAAAAAWLIAESARYMVNATACRPSQGLTDPATARAITGGLSIACARLGQLVSQVADRLGTDVAADILVDAPGHDPVSSVARARRHLELAAAMARALDQALAAASDDMAGLCRPGWR